MSQSILLWIVNAWKALAAFVKKYWVCFALVATAIVVVFIGKWWTFGILLTIATIVALVETLKK